MVPLDINPRVGAMFSSSTSRFKAITLVVLTSTSTLNILYLILLLAKNEI